MKVFRASKMDNPIPNRQLSIHTSTLLVIEMDYSPFVLLVLVEK
jgi:hypothetical protein